MRRYCRCRETGAYCHGDPHCRTFDGLSYDCHGDGDFVLLDSADEGAVVHARFEPLVSPDASFTTGVAATEDGSSIIEVTVADGERTILIDGEVYGGGNFPATMTGVTLTVTDQTVGMVFPSGLVVNAARWWTDPNYIGGVYVYAPIAMSTVGVLGTNNGDRTDDWTVRTISGPQGVGNSNRSQRVSPKQFQASRRSQSVLNSAAALRLHYLASKMCLF